MSSSGLEPNGSADSNCVILYSLDRYHFHDVGCTSLHSPLCEANPDTTASTVATTDSTTSTTTTPTTTTTPIVH